ncbi:MAG: phosphoglycerate kinase [Clostridia bacterium]|nr:phosphoglycerate kinase [Clostridia bacterium]
MDIKNIIGVNVKNKKILFRPDINSPINSKGKIVNENRLNAVALTLKYMVENGAMVAIIAHQGDTLDYQNLISMEEHAIILSRLTGHKVQYIDDVCGDCAIKRIKNLKSGEAVLLGNLRYLTEEVSTFEKDVKLSADDMKNTYLVRRLAPLFDLYVNEAFSAAHRNAPSMVAFQRILPSYAGPLFFKEYEALSRIMKNATRPVTFVLGGAKISDAFGMMEKVLKDRIADYILVAGVTGQIMVLADGKKIGDKYENWLASKDLLVFVEQAKELLSNYREKFVMPVDLAYESEGKRLEISVLELPKEEMFTDLGHETVEIFKKIILSSGTIFVNGPAGVYESELSSYGTSEIWNAIGNSEGYSLIGGGDTVTAATKFVDLSKFSYICTAGGAMVRFLSGKRLPLIEAMLSGK